MALRLAFALNAPRRSALPPRPPPPEPRKPQAGRPPSLAMAPPGRLRLVKMRVEPDDPDMSRAGAERLANSPPTTPSPRRPPPNLSLATARPARAPCGLAARSRSGPLCRLSPR